MYMRVFSEVMYVQFYSYIFTRFVASLEQEGICEMRLSSFFR